MTVSKSEKTEKENQQLKFQKVGSVFKKLLKSQQKLLSECKKIYFSASFSKLARKFYLHLINKHFIMIYLESTNNLSVVP